MGTQIDTPAKQAAIAPATVSRDLTVADLGRALGAGWRDFAACPVFGLFFAGIYVSAGVFLYFALFSWGQVAWLIPAAAGFPLLAPFVAVGFMKSAAGAKQGCR